MKTFFSARSRGFINVCVPYININDWQCYTIHTMQWVCDMYALSHQSRCAEVTFFFKNRRAAPCSPKGTHLHTQWRHQETTTTAINTMNTTCRIAPNSFYYVEKNVLSSFNVNSEFSHLLFYFKLFCFVGFLRFVCVQAQEFPHLFAFRMYTNRNKNQSTHTAFLFQSMNVFTKLH